MVLANTKWRNIKLGDFCDIIMGQSPPSSTYNEDGRGLPFFQGVKDFGRVYPSKRVYCTANTRKIAQAGDVLLSVRAPVGEINIASERCIIGRGIAALRAKTGNKNDQKFLYYLIVYNKKVWKQFHSGTTFEEITKEDIENLEISVPESFSERCKIVEILSSLDDKIELNYEMNKNLKAIAQAIFKSWFVDFEPFKDELVYNEELGKEIPKGWEAVKISDVASLKKGLSYSSKDLTNKSEVGLVNLKCIARGGGFRNEVKPYSGKFKQNHILQVGDIIIAITDLTRNREIIGMPARIYPVNGFKLLIASLDLVILNPKDEKRLKRSFLYHLLLTRDYWGYVNGCADGTTVLHLNPIDVLNYNFVLPPEEWQDRFAKIADLVFEYKVQNFKEMQILEKIRDTLLPKLLSGEIRVKVDIEEEFPKETEKLVEIRKEKARVRKTLLDFFKGV